MLYLPVQNTNRPFKQTTKRKRRRCLMTPLVTVQTNWLVLIIWCQSHPQPWLSVYFNVVSYQIVPLLQHFQVKLLAAVAYFTLHFSIFQFFGLLDQVAPPPTPTKNHPCDHSCAGTQSVRESPSLSQCQHRWDACCPIFRVAFPSLLLSLGTGALNEIRTPDVDHKGAESTLPSASVFKNMAKTNKGRRHMYVMHSVSLLTL